MSALEMPCVSDKLHRLCRGCYFPVYGVCKRDNLNTEKMQAQND
jgi:hypothetical protein